MQTFRIAELTITVEAEELLPPGEKWSKFLAEGDRSSLRYIVRYADALPSVQDEPFFRDDRVRFYHTQQGVLRIYSNFTTHEDSTAVLEEPDGTQRITILRNRYPWGTRVEHLFEMYNLPHYLPLFGRMMLHCSYILYEGEAILFTAPSGTGKSTQAELWRQHMGARIVNGDRAAVAVSNGCVMAYGLPFSGSSDDCENLQAPVRAIVSLSQAKENRIERMSGKNALRELMRGAYILPENRADFPLQLDIASQIVGKIPIFHLACLPDADAVHTLRTHL